MLIEYMNSVVCKQIDRLVIGKGSLSTSVGQICIINCLFELSVILMPERNHLASQVILCETFDVFKKVIHSSWDVLDQSSLCHHIINIINH